MVTIQDVWSFLRGEDNGLYDPTLAFDPATGRVWMVFSRVDGPGGQGQVSTHLAYSDDGGLEWCYEGLINQSDIVQPHERPGEYADAVSAHWSQEVPSIAYDPVAPEEERWRILWHRYLHVDDGIPANDDRRFPFGWIASRSASEPSLLASANEEKLFSAAAYHFSPAIESYNNNILDLPDVQLHTLHRDLADCLAFSEPGMQAYNEELYVSLVCARLEGRSSVILVRLDHESQTWDYVSTLLTADDAQTMETNWQSFSATDLFAVEDKHYLLVSPVSNATNVYVGCVLFRVDLETGTVMRMDDGSLDDLLRLPAGERVIQTGVCTFDPASTETGIIIGDAVWEEPQFQLYATGMFP